MCVVSNHCFTQPRRNQLTFYWDYLVSPSSLHSLWNCQCPHTVTELTTCVKPLSGNIRRNLRHPWTSSVSADRWLQGRVWICGPGQVFPPNDHFHSCSNVSCDKINCVNVKARRWSFLLLFSGKTNSLYLLRTLWLSYIKVKMAGGRYRGTAKLDWFQAPTFPKNRFTWQITGRLMEEVSFCALMY